MKYLFTKKIKKTVTYLWLLIIPFLFLQSFILNPQKISTLNNDILYLTPLYSEFKEGIVDNKYFPLWQNKTLLGSPLLGDPQSILSYPFNYLSLFTNLQIYFILYLLFHLIVSSFSMYFIGRKIIKLPVPASLLISFIYTFSPKMLSHLAEGHLSLVAVYSLFPLVVISFYFFIKKPHSLSSLSLGLLLSLFWALYVTIFYYTVLALIISAVFLLISASVKLSKKLIAYSLLVVISAVGFQLPQLLAELELWPQLNRSLLTYSDIAGPAYSWKQLLSYILVPLYVSKYPPEFMFYLGLPALILASLGFIRIRNKSHRVLIMLILIIIFLYSFGAKTPLYSFAFKFIPGVNLFRVPSRSFFLVTFIVSILAGLGYNYLKNSWGKVLASLLAVICFAEYLFVSNQIIKSKSQVNYTLPKELYTDVLHETDSYFRVYCTSACVPYEDIKDKNIGLANGYNPVQLTNVVNFQQKMGGYQFASYAPILPPYQTFVDKPQPDSQNLSLMRVKYVISSYPLTDPNLHPVKNLNNFYLYENSIVAPRAFTKVRSSIFPVNVTSDLPGIIKLDIESKGEVIVSEVYTPSWRAYQKGKRIKVNQYADIALSAVAEGGEIIFKYTPYGSPISWTVPLLMYTIILIRYLKSLIKR